MWRFFKLVLLMQFLRVGKLRRLFLELTLTVIFYGQSVAGTGVSRLSSGGGITSDVSVPLVFLVLEPQKLTLAELIICHEPGVVCNACTTILAVCCTEGTTDATTRATSSRRVSRNCSALC